jgi:hypothetical protein
LQVAQRGAAELTDENIMGKILLITGSISGLIVGKAFAASEYNVQHKSVVARCAVYAN